MMGLSVLRTLEQYKKKVTSSWSLMWQTEQFNLSLRLENKYEVKTLSVTTADTITQVLKNLLIRCDLSVSEDTLMMGP